MGSEVPSYGGGLSGIRLQNSPYFCVFKYGRAVKQKVGNEAENRERDWGEVFSRPGVLGASASCK